MAENKTQTKKSRKKINPEVIEEIKGKIEELSIAIGDLYAKLEEITKEVEKKSGKKQGKANFEFKNEIVNLSFAGRKVLVTNLITNTTSTIVPNDSLSLTPNNIYRFQLDKEFNLIKLKSPYDETFELVGFDKNIIKIRPRRNVTLKNNEPVFVILA